MRTEKEKPDLNSRSPSKIHENIGITEVKSKISLAIGMWMREKKLSRTNTGELLGISQERVTDLLIGKLKGFTIENLFLYLTMLGNDVFISITPKKSRQHGEVFYKGITDE